MLRFTPIANAKQAESYYQKSDAGYYRQGELRCEWGGKGSALLGLAGPPEYEQFRRLIHGLDPHSDEQMTAKLIEERIPGWDVTACLPKGVTSVLECGDERIHDLLWWAGRKAMADLEQLATTRVRKGGREEDRLTQNILWYGKEDAETRPLREDGMPDWDRHIHFVVFNLTRDREEGAWKALKFRPIMDLRKYFSHRFDMYMAWGLAHQLGYEIETSYKLDEKEGWKYYSYDIKGIPESVIARNSRRSAEVAATEQAILQKLKEEKGVELAGLDPVTRDKLGATSRLGKANLTLEECRDYWQGRLTQQENRQIAETIRRAVNGLNPTPPQSSAQGVAFAIEHWFHRHSVLDQKKRQVTGLYVTAMERSMGGAMPEDLDLEFRKQGVLSDRPGLPVWDARKEVTTDTTYRQERFIRDFAREGRGSRRPVVPPQTDLRPLLAGREGTVDLTGEQARAIEALLRSRDAVNVVDAGQGTGKTTMLERYGKILDHCQVRTTWLGTTHTAVHQLTARGLAAMTVAGLLHSDEMQRRAAGSRIILDEASMLAHQDAYRLFEYARANGCRIDLVGDSRQYKTPAAGDPVRLLTQHAGVVPVTMTKTMRQQGRLKEAMEAIRDGKVLKGHDLLDGLGMVHELPQEELALKAADLYLRWTAAGDEVPVISPTHAQAADIAARIRQGLRERGDVTGEDRAVRRLVNLDWSPAQIREARKRGAEGVVLLRYGAYRQEVQALAVGDLVRTTMGGKTRDGKHRLCNGQRYRIKGFTADGDPILNNNWVVDKDWGGLVQRYVSTGQGAQGITAQRGIVVYGTPSLVATRREGFYVPVSRVRKEVAVLTDSKLALREAIQRQDARKSATELLEARRRRRPSRLLQRLGRHLAYLRRLAFDRAHAERPGGESRTQSSNREIDYGR